MKKWFFIAILSGGLYFYATETRTGKNQWERLCGWFSQSTEKLTASEATIYKIQNPDGTWTFSNEKPQTGTTAIKQNYRTDTNVMPPVSSEKPEGQTRR